MNQKIRRATKIEDLLARPKAYYNIDGVGELSMGLLFLGSTGYHWMLMHTPRESAWHQVPVFLIYWGAMCLVMHYGSKAIKKHITYPRTGFVQYPKQKTLWAAAMGAVVASAIGAFIWIFRPHGLMTLESLIGLVFAGAYAYGVARVWLVRWKWIVVSAMALGWLAIVRFPAAGLGTYWNTFAVYGTLLMVSGAVTLILYLQRTRAAQ